MQNRRCTHRREVPDGKPAMRTLREDDPPGRACEAAWLKPCPFKTCRFPANDGPCGSIRSVPGIRMVRGRERRTRSAFGAPPRSALSSRLLAIMREAWVLSAMHSQEFVDECQGVKLQVEVGTAWMIHPSRLAREQFDPSLGRTGASYLRPLDGRWTTHFINTN
jgi:hypothetical protein